MPTPLLPNYLISNRKRLALSQEDVAFLLGMQGGAQMSRHERFTREPSLRNALAYEVIYRRAASELFGGLYAEVETEVATRAQALLFRKTPAPPIHTVEPRRKALTAIARQLTEDPS